MYSRTLSTVLTNLVELHGWPLSGGEEWLNTIDVLKPLVSDPFTSKAVLSALKDFLDSNTAVKNLCNRLVSDVTGASVRKYT